MLIWVSGPTGSGKTSLCEVFRTYGYSVVAEELPETQFAAFKSDPARHCSGLQEEIIRSRFNGWKRLAGSRRIVFDRSIDEDIHIFCQMHFERGLLSKNEFTRLTEIANNLQSNIPGPDLIVFLRPSEAALSARATAHSHPEVIIQTLNRQISLYSEWLERKTGEILVLDNSKCELTTVQRLFSEILS